MSNKTNGLSRLTPGQPKNIPELAAAAKNFYGTGRKMEGINAICDALELLSLGVKRQFDEDAAMLGRLVELNANLVKAIEVRESSAVMAPLTAADIAPLSAVDYASLAALREVQRSLEAVLKAPTKEEKQS